MFRRRPSLRGQRGNALVEYVLLLTLIALAVVMGVSFFGYSVSGEMGAVGNAVASAFGAGSAGSGSGSGSGGATNGGGSGHGHGGGNGGQNNGNGSGGQDNGTGNGK
jgi:Flp pilus assembly pilin Flp